MKLNDIDGSYYTSFFCITLRTNEDPAQAMKNYPSTFAHEFVHYLQDLILPYSIRVNLSNLRWFYNICKIAIENKSIQRRFDKWDEDSRITKLQYNYTWGQFKSVDKVWKMGDITSEFCTENGYDNNLNKYRTFDIYKYNLSINQHKSYQLGAIDLLEYISYKIEVKHYNVENLASLPYCSVDLLFKKYKLLHVSEDIRLCIAEFCLYNDNPMHVLFQMFLENEEFLRISKTLKYKDIYTKLLKGSFLTKDDVSETITDKTSRRLKQLATELILTYGSLDRIADWVLLANKFSMEQLSDRFIFSDIYKMSTVEFEKFEQLVLSKIGLPLLMNRAEKRISLLPDNTDYTVFDQLYIACKLKYFVTSSSTFKSKCCPITEFCNENYNAQYTQCNKELKLGIKCNPDCPYAYFLRNFRIENVKII